MSIITRGVKKAVIIDCYNHYSLRIQYVEHVLAEMGYEVSIYFSDFDHFSKKYLENKKAEIHYIHVSKYDKNISLRRIMSIVSFGLKVERVLKKEKPDILYTIIPPNTLLYIFKKYKTVNSNVKIIFDVFDMWPETMPIYNQGLLYKLIEKGWKSLRDKNIECSDLVITECNLFKNILKQKKNNLNLKTAYLCKEKIRQIHRSDYRNKEISFIYIGSINNIVDIELIVEIFSKLAQKKYRINLHIIGEGEQKDKFKCSAKNEDVSVYDHGMIFDNTEKEKIASKCHFGLNIMKSSVCVGLTMKSIDYFSLGLPIINNISFDTWELVEREKIGFNILDQNSKNVADKIVECGVEKYASMCRNVTRIYDEYFSEKTFTNILREEIARLLKGEEKLCDIYQKKFI